MADGAAVGVGAAGGVGGEGALGQGWRHQGGVWRVAVVMVVEEKRLV